MNLRMTRLAGFALVCGLFVGGPAMAEDHAVSAAALSSLGLGDMQTANDVRGLQVRGRGSYASVGGGSWAFGGITVYSGFGMWSQGGIDADSYSAVDKSHYGSAHASADPRGAVVRVPQMQVVVNELDSAGNVVPVAFVDISGGVAAGNAALRHSSKTAPGPAANPSVTLAGEQEEAKRFKPCRC